MVFYKNIDNISPLVSHPPGRMAIVPHGDKGYPGHLAAGHVHIVGFGVDQVEIARYL